MTRPASPLPSVDEVLRGDIGRVTVNRFGHSATLGAVRAELRRLRDAQQQDALQPDALRNRQALADVIARNVLRSLEEQVRPSLRRVFNLTGTVLHTNLGRAVLPETAIAAAAVAMRHPAALEFDLATGQRGERDDLVRSLVCDLTGAEDAIVVNNNAAAVLLVLNAIAAGRETIVSRGELIEIGDAFRIPEIMTRAGTKLVEVGTTNRTHLKDYAGAIGASTALIMKVHKSNYRIDGFTKEVRARELSMLARGKNIPLVDDLGSGTLVDLSRWGLSYERTVQDAIADGADLVTFSGDKLLGGPQAGFIVGRRELVQLCARNPIKRAVRLDKVRLAALEATLKLYRNPDRLAETLPTLRYFSRRPAELRVTAQRLVPGLQSALGARFEVAIRACASQIGSGALPMETIASIGISVEPKDRKSTGRNLEQLLTAFRALPIPVIGRIDKGMLLLDLRCLDDEAEFVSQLDRLEVQ